MVEGQGRGLRVQSPGMDCEVLTGFAMEMEAGGGRGCISHSGEKEGPGKVSKVAPKGKTPHEDKWLIIFRTLMLNIQS